jgi:hypothetical protein
VIRVCTSIAGIVTMLLQNESTILDQLSESNICCYLFILSQGDLFSLGQFCDVKCLANFSLEIRKIG